MENDEMLKRIERAIKGWKGSAAWAAVGSPDMFHTAIADIAHEVLWALNEPREWGPGDTIPDEVTRVTSDGLTWVRDVLPHGIPGWICYATEQEVLLTGPVSEVSTPPLHEALLDTSDPNLVRYSAQEMKKRVREHYTGHNEAQPEFELCAPDPQQGDSVPRAVVDSLLDILSGVEATLDEVSKAYRSRSGWNAVLARKAEDRRDACGDAVATVRGLLDEREGE